MESYDVFPASVRYTPKDGDSARQAPVSMRMNIKSTHDAGRTSHAELDSTSRGALAYAAVLLSRANR